MPPGQIGFRCVLCLSAVPLAECRLLHCYHGFCEGCMRDWVESNRVGPQRRLRQLHCPTCRKPARESDLGRMFVETVVLDEDTEYQTRLVNAITEQMNSTRDSVRTISSTSGTVQVTNAISGVVQSQNALSTSQYAKTDPIVKNVTEKLSEITDDLEHRIRPVFERVAKQDQEIVSLKTETVRLREKLQSINNEKQQTELYLDQALLAGERLKEIRDSAKLATLQKAQEVESLSKEVARLIKQSFTKGNEIVDLKEQCDESQAEIERLNELLEASKCASNKRRRTDEDNNDGSSPLATRRQLLSPSHSTKRVASLRTRDNVARTEKPTPWKMSPTIVPLPGRPSKLSKHNPFHNGPKGVVAPVVATTASPHPPRRHLFKSDWNLDHLKEKRKKPEQVLPFKVDSKAKPMVPVFLGSRLRMTSKS